MTKDHNLSNKSTKLTNNTFANNSANKEPPHILWIGCGDLLCRTIEALHQLCESYDAQLVFVDICDQEKVKQLPPCNASFFNVSKGDERFELRKYLWSQPLTHIFVANWPPQHLLTAFKFSEMCPGGQIIISKPMDINLPLIEAVASGAWPDITNKIFVHDHYRNKGAVEPMFQALPALINTYGRVRDFEFYLIECKTVEEEKRLEALNEGVIFDLASHLFAIVQLFFLDSPNVALIIPELALDSVSLEIRKVARARYANCQIENSNAETFAAVELTIIAHYSKPGNMHPLTYRIPGLIVVGKGIKPSQSIYAALKGLRFNLELQTRSVNLVRNEVNPPLSDLQFVSNNWQEDGFNAPIVTALSHKRPSLEGSKEKILTLMPFKHAAQNARYLGKSLRIASPLLYYSKGDTLDAVMAKCVGAEYLDHRWLSSVGYSDIGFG